MGRTGRWEGSGARRQRRVGGGSEGGMGRGGRDGEGGEGGIEGGGSEGGRKKGRRIETIGCRSIFNLRAEKRKEQDVAVKGGPAGWLVGHSVSMESPSVARCDQGSRGR